jgi:hypothetical protein
MSLLVHWSDLINSVPLDIPDPGPVAPPGFAGPVGIIMGWAKWVGLIVAVLGVIIIGAKLAINVRRGEAAGELGGLLYVGLGCILIGAAASLVGFLSGS